MVLAGWRTNHDQVTRVTVLGPSEGEWILSAIACICIPTATAPMSGALAVRRHYPTSSAMLILALPFPWPFRRSRTMSCQGDNDIRPSPDPSSRNPEVTGGLPSSLPSCTSPKPGCRKTKERQGSWILLFARVPARHQDSFPALHTPTPSCSRRWPWLNRWPALAGISRWLYRDYLHSGKCSQSPLPPGPSGAATLNPSHKQ